MPCCEICKKTSAKANLDLYLCNKCNVYNPKFFLLKRDIKENYALSESIIDKLPRCYVSNYLAHLKPHVVSAAMARYKTKENLKLELEKRSKRKDEKENRLELKKKELLNELAKFNIDLTTIDIDIEEDNELFNNYVRKVKPEHTLDRVVELIVEKDFFDNKTNFNDILKKDIEANKNKRYQIVKAYFDNDTDNETDSIDDKHTLVTDIKQFDKNVVDNAKIKALNNYIKKQLLEDVKDFELNVPKSLKDLVHGLRMKIRK